MSETILFFGNERLATGVATTAPTLRALIASGYNIAAVVANETPSLSRQKRELEVASVANDHAIPVFLPRRVLDIKAEIEKFGAVAAILVAYGKIVPQSIIDIFPKGIINIHPSLLPLHRGPTPIESVILEGAERTGVSLMQLVKEMDAGPVYAQTEIELSRTEAKQDLVDKLLGVGSELLIRTLPAILSGTLEPVAQDNSAATYDSLITKSAGIVDWNKPAVEIERQIRAYAGWPKSRTTIASKEVIIIQASRMDLSGEPGDVTVIDQQLIIFARSGALSIKRLKPADKKEMEAAAFIAGYGALLR